MYCIYLIAYIAHPFPQDLADKIAQLNSAIDDVSAQLNSKDVLPVKEEATA